MSLVWAALINAGDDGLTELVLRTANSFPAKNLNDPNKLIEKDAAAEWAGRFRAYFPSKESIENSKGGKSNAGTICFQQKWFDGPRFPRHVMRDCSSVRPGLMMHNKVPRSLYSG